jgi:8-oxo-dGTP pyrophosphatase MutT (NUDIX family)
MRPDFPNAFQCYVPRNRKIYGCICISDKNNILLVKGRESQKWSFPKGHIEGRETAQMCARRELFEETGIRIEQEPFATRKYFAGEYFFFQVPREYRPFPRDTREIEEARWVSFDEIFKMNVNIDVSRFRNYLRKMEDRSCPLHPTSIQVGA